VNPCAHSQNTGTPRDLGRPYGTVRDAAGRSGTLRDGSCRSLVFPGGRRVNALDAYPVSLPCGGCGVDLAEADADIHVLPDARTMTVRCPACDLAERCGAEGE
jgi:hypothetical protein